MKHGVRPFLLTLVVLFLSYSAGTVSAHHFRFGWELDVARDNDASYRQLYQGARGEVGPASDDVVPGGATFRRWTWRAAGALVRVWRRPI